MKKIFMTLLQKGFSHREEAKSTKIFKKKFKKLKNLLGFLSFFFAIIKIPSRSSRSSRLRGKRDVFAVDSLIFFDLFCQCASNANVPAVIGWIQLETCVNANVSASASKDMP